MILIKQTDKRLLPVINDIGCFFRSSLAIAEIKSHKELTAEQINHLWNICKNYQYIDDKNRVTKSAKIINLGFEFLNVNHFAIEVGTFKEGITTFYKWTEQNKRYQRIDALIQKVITVNGNTHFRVVDHRGDIIFDPYEPKPEVKSIEYSILYYIN